MPFSELKERDYRMYYVRDESKRRKLMGNNATNTTIIDPEPDLSQMVPVISFNSLYKVKLLLNHSLQWIVAYLPQRQEKQSCTHV